MSVLKSSVSVAVSALLALLSGTALAEVGRSGALAETAPLVKVQAEVAYAARLRLNDLERAATTPFERDAVSVLSSLYAERDFAPLWFTSTAPTAAAKAVAAELVRARDWGLDPAAFFVPRLDVPPGDGEARISADVLLSFAVARYAIHARGGRVDPSALSKWLDQRPRAIDVKALLPEIAASGDAAKALIALHPRHAGFENLRRAYLKLLDPKAAGSETDLDRLPPGGVIAVGERHPDIAILRRRLGILATAANETLYDERLARAVATYLKRGRRVTPQIDNKVREALNNPPELREKRRDAVNVQKLLVNMERWRWLPDDLGALHVWNSLTEFESRVMKDGQVVHEERIIIGKPDTQTPVFSDRMEYIVFQPDWGVPNSIKVKQLLPELQDGNDSILEERGMKILIDGKERDPSRYDWDKIDIRYVPVFQGPGPSNPLGQMKFMFPNKHDVYMHDTPQKSLFNDKRRTYSHGCIRVRNPRKLAELVMALDQGWTPEQVGAVLHPKAKPTNRVELTTPIPVHNVYFTAVADADGNVETLSDIYEHDSRIADALAGVPVEEIAERDPARELERELEEIAPTGKQAAKGLVEKKGWSSAQRRERSGRSRDDDYVYVPPKPRAKPVFTGYSGLGYFAPPPKPVYKPAKSGFRSPPSLYELVLPPGAQN